MYIPHSDNLPTPCTPRKSMFFVCLFFIVSLCAKLCSREAVARQHTGLAFRKTSNEDQEVRHRRRELNTSVKAQCKVWQLPGQPGGWQNSSNNFIPSRRKSVLAGSGHLNEADLTQAGRHAQDLDRRKGRQCHQKDQSIPAQEVWLKYKACVCGNEVIKHTGPGRRPAMTRHWEVKGRMKVAS